MFRENISELCESLKGISHQFIAIDAKDIRERDTIDNEVWKWIQNDLKPKLDVMVIDINEDSAFCDTISVILTVQNAKYIIEERQLKTKFGFETFYLVNFATLQFLVEIPKIAKGEEKIISVYIDTDKVPNFVTRVYQKNSKYIK